MLVFNALSIFILLIWPASTSSANMQTLQRLHNFMRKVHKITRCWCCPLYMPCRCLINQIILDDLWLANWYKGISLLNIHCEIVNEICVITMYTIFKNFTNCFSIWKKRKMAVTGIHRKHFLTQGKHWGSSYGRRHQ